MPRLRVDRDTSDTDVITAMQNLFTRSHELDAELANPRLFDIRQRREIETVRNDLHVEINRLITIMAARRARSATVA